MLTIGLTGGIGTGKTQVAGILEEFGALIVGADLLGHEVYRKGTDGWAEVVEAFGEEVLDSEGEVDRRKLGRIVFSDPQALSRLNAIVHPRIFRLVGERVEEARASGRPVTVVEAALLIEAGWDAAVDEVWVVTSSEDHVMERLRDRDNMDEDSARARIAAQMTQEERLRHADAIIDNDGNLAELRARVQELWSKRVHAREES